MLLELRKLLQESGSIIFRVRVRPGAPESAVTSVMADGTLKIDVAAAPEDGEANEELVRFLAAEFGVSCDRVAILSGATSRRKTIRIIAA